jgi:hypothetical protein
MNSKPLMTTDQLLVILKKRFQDFPHRHPGITWQQVEKKLIQQPKKLKVLLNMEMTDGEPDVVVLDAKANTIMFADCVKKAPKSRVSVCYDQAAWDSRKEFKPKAGNAVTQAEMIGATLINETQYLLLQNLEDFDTTTSSWILTPPSIRKLGGALFGDKRFGRAFIFHNGAESYYGERGFRTVLEI